MQITGSCHCGNISFTLDWRGDPDKIPARACSCTFCRKHGALWTSNPESSLAVTVRDPALAATYRFATGTGLFHFCARCGVPLLVTCRIDERTYAVVNVNVLNDLEPSRLRRVEASFDGEAIESRLARRQRNWIGDVTITSPPG